MIALSRLAVPVVGAAAIGVLSYFLYQQIQANGELEQVNAQWRDRMAEVEQRIALIDELDGELDAIRREQQANYQRLQTDLGRLRDEIPEVREWADTRIPDAMVVSLCERGAIAESYCDPGEIPGNLPSSKGTRGDDR